MLSTNSHLYTNHSIDQTLYIKRVTDLDPYAIAALVKTEADIIEGYKSQNLDNQNSNNQSLKDSISTQVRSVRLGTLSERLNHTGLDDITRLLLSNPNIYAILILIALKRDRVQPDDVDGLYNSVLWSVDKEPRKFFLARLITEVLNAKRIQVKETNLQWQKLDDLTLEYGIPIRKGKVEPAVSDLLAILYKEGEIPYYVNKYIEQGEIPDTAITPPIRQTMVDYLVKLGVQIKPKQFNEHVYDKYFALAYSEALKRSAVADDPIDVVRIKGGEVSWDFVVDTFDTAQEQGVIPANILAAGALDYLYYIGEGMRVFDIANSLVLRWATGALDIPDGKAAAALYRFHKLRSERSTPEERAMLYKRVLNKGNGQLLANMVVNETFPGYWHQLMSEAAEYIRKREGSLSKESRVSRAPLYQATKNLQYNLTEYMTGMAHLQVTEDYAHLQEAMALLKDDDILEHFGGRRRSQWNVIERIAKEDFGIAIPTAVIRTLAIEGNKVYQWIANFNEGVVREDEFNTFLRAAEAWIIAQAAVESDNNFLSSSDSRLRLKASDDDSDEEDNFDDWDV